ncbi:hypothetical protein SRABI66_02271 [Stenotrophomonas lactitubi]|nr:hypothetical protein SRABI66_02271 [Stenotrophomonas lactitubi]
MGGAGRAAPGTRIGLQARAATATATATAGFLWDGGVGPVAGDAVNPSLGAWPRHSCRGHPRNRTHPAFDRFRDLPEWHEVLLVGVDLGRHVDPRHAWMKSNPFDDFEIGRNIHPLTAWMYQISGNCQRWGGMGRQDRWRHGWRHRAPMDGFTACPACPYRRAQLGSPLLPLLAVASAGAGRSPAEAPAHAAPQNALGEIPMLYLNRSKSAGVRICTDGNEGSACAAGLRCRPAAKESCP